MRRVLFAALLSASIVGAHAGNETPARAVVLPPDAKVDGASVGEWTGRWWSWALSQPIAPFLDPDGRLCEVGQDGPVWYLAGTNGRFDAQRECVVPAGKHLLVPIINMIYRDRDAKHARPCADMQADAAVNNEHLVSAVVLLDGEPLTAVDRFRVRSDGCFVLGHDEEGGEIRAAADGYWLMLEPLAPGRHTLVIGANYGAPEQPYGRMLQNFEYVLHVGKVSTLSDANAGPRPDRRIAVLPASPTR